MGGMDGSSGTNGRGARSTANGRGEKLLLGQARHQWEMSKWSNPKDTLTCVARAGTLFVQRRLLGHDRLKAWSLFIPCCYKPHVAEAIAFGRDCKRLVDGWNDFLGVLQHSALLINYRNLHSFNFVNRLPNKAADNLAKLASFFVKERYWVEEIPPPPQLLSIS